MKTAHRVIVAALAVLPWLSVPAAAQEPEPDDVADVPCQDLKAGGDAAKRCFLIGPAAESKPPAAGAKLLVVFPGGAGGADMNPFLRRIWKNALPPDWAMVQLVAPPFKTSAVTWPRKEAPVPGMDFTAEELYDAALAEVRKKLKVDPRSVFVLGWSSGGPPAYSVTLRGKNAAAGAFVSMSVFFPEKLPKLAGAKGKAFHLHQSKEDTVCRFEHAEKARDALRTAGADVELAAYDGGHGWHGDVFGQIRDGVSWLAERQKKR